MVQRANKVLVAHDSKLGSTKEVAAFIGDILSKGGASVDVRNIAAVQDLGPYDLIIIGAAIRYDRWLPDAAKFVRDNQDSLKGKPVAFFFTCLTLAKRSPETERKAETYADDLKRISPEVQPISVGQFAGVLSFRRGPLPIRLLLRVLSIATGVKEGDYRDWDAIRSWAAGLYRHP